MTNQNDEVVVYEQGEGEDRGIVAAINDRLNKELADPAAFRALVATTFNGLDEQRTKQALMEGMIRGFKFEDFLQKNVYAVPFGGAYSLVTSIDNNRKIGMRSGVIGKGAPVYRYKDEEKKKIDECDVTIKRLVHGHVGEFTATVDFDEYTTGRNLWKTKPKTMIAKVAEMHALRMACPEELAQMYTEEEMHKEVETPNRYQAAKQNTQSLKMGELKSDGNKKESEDAQDQKEETDHAESDTAES